MNLTNYTFKFTDLSNNPKQVSSSLQKYGFVVLHSLPQNYVKEVCKEVITHFDVTEGPLQKPRSAPFFLIYSINIWPPTKRDESFYQSQQNIALASFALRHSF